jgi:enamine deaminase RidA (YjgF/YER057c/UK114 family)
MDITQVDPPNMKHEGLTQGALVTGASKLLFITGQPPISGDDVYETPPQDFETQARIVWGNVLKILAEAGMTVKNLVKVTTFLTSREHRETNSKLRQEILEGHLPSLGIYICGMWDESWLLEIEAIAAA